MNATSSESSDIASNMNKNRCNTGGFEQKSIEERAHTNMNLNPNLNLKDICYPKYQ